MIAYACQASRPEDRADYARWCEPGLKRVIEPQDQVKLFAGASIHQGYNQAIDWVSEMDNLEALVLLHADLEILDLHYTTRLRNLLKRDPLAAVVGVCGARRAFGLEWWVRECYGGVLHEDPGDFRFHSEGDHAVDIVDGCILALRGDCLAGRPGGSLRFDEEAYLEAPWYAYDGDISYEARDRGMKVFVMDTRVQHHTRGGVDTRTFALAEAAFLRKWALRGLWGPAPPAGSPGKEKL